MGGRTLFRALARRVLAARSVPPHIVLMTALATIAGLFFAVLQGWPLWGFGVAVVLPWLPILTLEMAWAYRHYDRLALFYILVLSQVGHFFEHVAQMVQIHLLGLSGLNARGIFGTLDIEWVHFVFNSWVIIAASILVAWFRRNPWLWATLVIAGWHEVEHVSIMATYLTTGKAGSPGLLSRGGLIGGGLPISRPDLHFLYNLVETIPLVIALGYQIVRSYDEWLKKAFPHLPEPVLVDTTGKLQILRFPAGAQIIREGDRADRFYIVTSGSVEVVQADQDGRPRVLGTLLPGQYFGEIGALSLGVHTASVHAETPVEVLALDRGTLQHLVKISDATAEDLGKVALGRLQHTPG